MGVTGVAPAGLEPATSRFSVEYSYRLSYGAGRAPAVRGANLERTLRQNVGRGSHSLRVGTTIRIITISVKLQLERN